MKRLTIILSALLLMNLFAGCGGERAKRIVLPAGVSSDIAILSLGADTSGLNDDQVALLQHTLNWMDRNITQALNRKGFRASHIKNESEFTGANNSHLLRIRITSHKMIPKSARFMAGKMAGADVLAARYELVDGGGRIVHAWDDTQASTRGGAYCAQTLNRNAAEKVGTHLGS